MLVHLAIFHGLDKMLTDVLPGESGVLIESFKQMNLDNPEYIGDFIIRKMEEGEAKSLAEKWKKDRFYL